jgi:hypothetical protein
MPQIPDYAKNTAQYKHLITKVDYTSKRGERRIRNVIPISIRHTQTPDDPKSWILDVYDVDQAAFKSYLFTRINGFPV